jgi:hypothetical protein
MIMLHKKQFHKNLRQVRIEEINCADYGTKPIPFFPAQSPALQQLLVAVDPPTAVAKSHRVQPT